MRAYDTKGARLIKVSGISDVLIGSGKINVQNDADGTLYTLGCKTVDGEPVLYLIFGGTARVKNGRTQILNDTDHLWYSIGCNTVSGEPVLYLVQPGEA